MRHGASPDCASAFAPEGHRPILSDTGSAVAARLSGATRSVQRLRSPSPRRGSSLVRCCPTSVSGSTPSPTNARRLWRRSGARRRSRSWSIVTRLGRRARGVVTAGATAAMLRRDFVDQIGANRDPRTVTRTELVECIDRVRDGVPGQAKPRPGLVSTFRARLYGLFETAVARGVANANPLAGYSPTPAVASAAAGASCKTGGPNAFDGRSRGAMGRVRRSPRSYGIRRLRPGADRLRVTSR